MHSFRILRIAMLALMCVGAGSVSALAQQAMYPGQDVVVNPAGTRGTQVLLYPGGTYMRVVPQLLEPGAPYPGQSDIVRLHMPTKHARHKRPDVTNVATASASDQQTAESPPPVSKQKSPPKKVASSASPPAQESDNSGAGIPLSLTGMRPVVTPPAKSPAQQTQPAKQQPSKQAVATPPAKPQAPKPPPPKQVAANTQPPPETSDATDAPIPLNLSGPRAIHVTQGRNPGQVQQTASQLQQQPTKKPLQLATVTAPPPVQKPPAQDLNSGEKSSANDPSLSKHGQIKFRKNATDLVPAAMSGIRLLANDLTSALDAGAHRVQLEAYGGPPGDKSSESRRLSLKRALTIRQLLIDAGVPSSKIDVRAMGGASDGGAQDRVDVYVRA
jgi:outer membrane protein OmpA-like peptidoglycan-associated protein